MNNTEMALIDEAADHFREAIFDFGKYMVEEHQKIESSFLAARWAEYRLRRWNTLSLAILTGCALLSTLHFLGVF